MNDAVAGFDGALEHHKAAFGALKGMDEVGELGAMGPDFLRGRREAIKQAEAAAKRFRKFDLAKALASDDPKQVDRAIEAFDAYAAAVNRLDEVMGNRVGVSRPASQMDTQLSARSGATQQMGAEGMVPPVGGRARPAGVHDIPPQPTLMGQGPGNVRPGPQDFEVLPLDEVMARTPSGPMKTEAAYYELARDLDVAMALDDAARARYREIYGRDWVPNYDILQGGAMQADDIAALGGKVSDTSDVTTRAGKVKGPVTPVEAPSAPKAPGSAPRELPTIPDLPSQKPSGPGWAGETRVGAGQAGPGRMTDELGAVTQEARAASTAIEEAVGPIRRRSPLEAFAYDVQAAAGRLGDDASLKAVFDAIKAQRGRAPFTFDRFRELVGEAEVAGYLATTGARARVTHVGDVGEALIVRPEFRQGDPVKFSFRDRFDRFEDRGRWGNDTRPEFQAEGNLAHGPLEPPRRPPPDSVSVDEYPTPVDGPRPTQNLRGKTERTPANEGALAEALRKADEARPTDLDVPRQPEGFTPEPAEPSVWDYGGRMDEVLRSFEAQGPRATAADRAAEQVRAAIDALEELSAGRIGAVEAREAAIAAGLSDKPRSVLGQQLANLWGVRQLGRAASEGAKSGGRAYTRGSVLDRMARSAGGGALRRFAAGGNVAAGAIGGASGALGGHLAGAMIGAAGSLAASVGKARDLVIKAGDRLLRGRGSRMAAAVPLAARYSYDGSEPTADVPTRIQQIQTALEDPEGTRQRVMESLGDLATTHPDIAAQVADDSLRKLANLRMRAPMFVWDAMGEARPAGAQSLRRFREYEDGTWNLPRLLDAVGSGSMTAAQADCLREQHPQACAALLERVFSDPTALRRAPRERLRIIEQLSGVQLRIGGPQYALRQQAAFPPPQQPGQNNPGAVKPPAQTPAQAQIAPGNR